MLAGMASSVSAVRRTHPYTRIDFLPTGSEERSILLNLPYFSPNESREPVRGILLWGNGAGADERGKVENLELLALADHLGFGLMATSTWHGFNDPTELTYFTEMLETLSTATNVGELSRAPILPVGMSNGGQMSYGLNALIPQRVIAFAANKGGFYNNPAPDASSLATPGLLIAGGTDSAYRRDAILGLFNTNRPRGAHWAWAEEQGIGHNIADSMELILPFVEAMAQLRYPRPLAPTPTISPTLLSINPENGWLVTRDSHLHGLADIYAYADFSGDRLAAGWLPSRRLAFIYRAFASHHKASPTATLTPTTPSVLRGTPLTYTIDPYDTAWSRIEYFDGDSLLRTAIPGDEDPFAVTMEPDTSGYAVLHALVTYPDGSRRTTMPRRKFVESTHRNNPGDHPEIFGNADLDAGAPLRLSANMIGINSTPAPELRWTRNGIRIPGQTTSTLNLAAVSPADAGIYQFVAAHSTSAFYSEPLHVFVTPVVIPMLGPITGPTTVNAATPVTLTVVVPDGQTGLQLQWHRNGQPITGATQSTLAFPLVQTWQAGTYTLIGRIRNAQTVSEAWALTVTAPNLNSGRLLNLSVRGRSGRDEQIMTAGYVIAEGEKSVLTRAVGAGLARLDVPGTLADPTLRLHRIFPPGSPNLIAENNDWHEHPEAASFRSTAARVGAFPLGETDPDATLLETLPPGAYTAMAAGADFGTGTVLLEVYDADSSAGRIINLSNRGYVSGADTTLVGGFVIGDEGPADLLIRAIGPGLIQHGVNGILNDPRITLYRINPQDSGAASVILQADNWGENDDSHLITNAAAIVGAFALPPTSEDAAVTVRLPPGIYSVVVQGTPEQDGVALLEIYQIPGAN